MLLKKKLTAKFAKVNKKDTKAFGGLMLKIRI